MALSGELENKKTQASVIIKIIIAIKSILIRALSIFNPPPPKIKQIIFKAKKAGFGCRIIINKLLAAISVKTRNFIFFALY